MILNVVKLIILILIVLTAGGFMFQTYQSIGAIAVDSAGYRSGEIDFTKQDYICSDSHINSNLESTLFGRTGCVSKGELEIKKLATDAALERGALFSLLSLLVGGVALVGVDKYFVKLK